jgi:hypothetical protein
MLSARLLIPTERLRARNNDPRDSLLRCGDGPSAEDHLSEMYKQNQMYNWLAGNLDLALCGQYGPRGF